MEITEKEKEALNYFENNAALSEPVFYGFILKQLIEKLQKEIKDLETFSRKQEDYKDMWQLQYTCKSEMFDAALEELANLKGIDIDKLHDYYYKKSIKKYKERLENNG